MAGSGLFIKVFFFLFIFLSFFNIEKVHAEEPIPQSYYLPADHPIKPLLDHIFSSRKTILSLNHLKKAGFTFSNPRKFTNLIVAKHKKLPGWIFKLYLDAQRYHKNKAEDYFWALRIQGSNLVRESIIKHNLENYVKVPKKWIYQLPKKIKSDDGYMLKNTILVQEDMQLLSDEDNVNLWKSSFVTYELLNAVYIVLNEVGLSDCAKPDNIPFSHDGKVAFIDTQTFGCKVPNERLLKFLSKENEIYWNTLDGK